MFVYFSWIGTILPLFYSDGKTSVLPHYVKIMANGLKIAGP